jgi:DNA-binding PadR family transcriptional regulator
MSIKHAILGLLAGGPRHGYDLKLAYEEEVAPSTSLNFGQVYTTLERLERDGLVRPEVVPQDVRPDKKVYALTEAGRKVLRGWLAAPTRQDLDLRNEAFLKLMLARRLPDADPLAVLANERRECMERLHEVTGARDQAEKEGSGTATLLLLDLAILRLEAFLKWLDRCEETLSREKKK